MAQSGSQDTFLGGGSAAKLKTGEIGRKPGPGMEMYEYGYGSGNSSYGRRKPVDRRVDDRFLAITPPEPPQKSWYGNQCRGLGVFVPIQQCLCVGFAARSPDICIREVR